MSFIAYISLIMLSLYASFQNVCSFINRRSTTLQFYRSAASHLSLAANDEKVLVIVESPAKAKTIQKIVGEKAKNYVIDYCAGHIRELCHSIAQLPKGYEQKVVYPKLSLKIAELGVDVHNNFEPIFVNSPQKREIITRLKKTSKTVSRILLATDEDREGEAISWHLVDILKPTVPYQRAVFHEITKTAIEKAFQEPRDIDMNLVKAQQTRSILDKLTGYTLSPLLWKFGAYGLSAGRVQTCGLHLITEKEKERWAFKSSNFYSITAFLKSTPTPSSSSTLSLEAKLVEWQGRKVADEKDFDGSSGGVKESKSMKKLVVLDAESAKEVLRYLSDDLCQYEIVDMQERMTTRNPPPPFITSTLQQEASRKLGFSPAQTMALAQGLYESGYITYMRTDSPVLSTMAQAARKKVIETVFGDDYLASSTSSSSSSSGKEKSAKSDGSNEKSDKKESKGGMPKNAQEAHEAIRPAEKNGLFQLTSELQHVINNYDALRLYDLILKRTLGSGMKGSKSKTITLTISATAADDKEKKALFRTSETIITFPGFLRCYEETLLGSHTKKASSSRREGETSEFEQFATIGMPLVLNKDVVITPTEENKLKQHEEEVSTNEKHDFSGDDIDIESDITSEEIVSNSGLDSLSFPGLKSSEHVTRPPARFTEASFVKELELLGVGRPSTYSSILTILKDRGYVIVDKQTLVPTGRGMIVSKFMAKHFPQFVDETFTAEMEKALDHIAHGELDKNEFLHDFYLKGYTPDAANDDQKEEERGLLAEVDEKLHHDLASGNSITETRSIVIPHLQQFGELSIYKGQLFFDFYEDAYTNNDGKDSGRRVIRKKIPTEVEADLRLLTPELLLTLRGNETYIDPDGVDLGLDQATGYRYKLRAGPFGRFIEVDRNRTRSRYQRVPVPAWVDSESISLTQAMELTTLPREVGIFPQTNTMIKVDLSQGKLRLSADNYAYQAELEDHLFPGDITLERAIELLSSSTVPNSSRKTLVGHWQDEEIVLRTGRFGPYLQWGKIFASLGKLDPENISEEQAIELLNKKLRRQARTGTGTAKVRAKKKIVAAAAAADDDDGKSEKKPKKVTRKGSKSSAIDSESEGESLTAAPVKKGRSRKVKAVAENGGDNEINDTTAAEASTATKKTTRKKSATKLSESDDESDHSEEEKDQQSVKKTTTRTTKRRMAVVSAKK